MNDTVEIITMPIMGKVPYNAPQGIPLVHGQPLIEVEDYMFQHYVYDGHTKMWVHVGGVKSLFHEDVIDAVAPEPESPDDAYNRAMGVLG